MCFLAQQNDALACLLQFGLVGFILFMSFVSWVVKKLFAAASQQSAAQRQAGGPRVGEVYQVQSNRPNPYTVRPGPPHEEPLVLEAEVIQANADRQVGSNLSSEHLAQHAAELGDLHDRGEAGAHEQFDYEVGRLGDSSDAIHEDPDADKLPQQAVTVAEIADVFRHPERIREAIILNEILTRPDFR